MVEGAVKILADGSVYVDVGPMQMRIHVWDEERLDSRLARAGAEKACSLLQELSAHKKIITRNIKDVEKDARYPGVVNRMIESVRETGDETMTPLAAVAGTVADEVADYIWELEKASKVMVNNGGDVAIRLGKGAGARVGVQEDISRSEFSSLLVVEDHHHIGGVATSGVGGRSLTRGIASAVTAAASSASRADAAATLIANAVDVDSPEVKRAPARTIDPATDIPHLPVTVSVGRLSEREVEAALGAGLETAERLRRRDLIAGAILALRGRVVVTDALFPLVHHAAATRREDKCPDAGI